MAKAVTSSECVFSDDLLLVDYLSAVISSAPPTQHEYLTEYVSPQIQPLPTIGPSFDPAPGRLTLVKNPKDAEIERLNTQLQTFRNDTERLKFSAELAKIDSEVLRGENKKLHAEIERLKTSQDSMRGILGKQQAENNDLTSQIADLQNQIRLLTEVRVEEIAAEECFAPVPDPVELLPVEDAAPVSDQVDLLSKAGVDDVEYVVSDHQEYLSELVEKTEGLVAPCLPQPKKNEISQVSIQERQVFSNSSSPHMVCDRVSGQDAQVKQPVDSFKNYPIPRTAPKKARVFSKVMKQQDIPEKQCANKQNELVSSQEQNKVQSEDHALSDRVLQQFTQLVQEVEPEESQVEEDLDLQKNGQDMKKPLDTDEIDMGPAPVSKVTSKRNASRYVIMQKEAEDDTHTPGHKITFVT